MSEDPPQCSGCSEAGDSDPSQPAGVGTRVGFKDLLRLKAKAQDDPATTPAYEAATEGFARDNPSVRFLVGASGATGVVLTVDGEFTYLINTGRVHFEWSPAQALVFRIDALAEQAREWWPVKKSSRKRRGRASTEARPEQDAPDSHDPKQGDGQEPQAATADARPHLDRAYTLMTVVLSAIERENRGRALSTTTGNLAPSKRFFNDLELAKPELERANSLLQIAGQSRAQAWYSRGMARGAACLALLSAVIALAFIIWDVPAWYAVAFPAGGIGAVVSVLQRMTTRTLSLDHHTSDEMLAMYGAVRPFIGGVFGMVLLALFEGGLAVNVDTNSSLAFYAALGFFAGFSERFAQDMLAGSVGALATQAPQIRRPREMADGARAEEPPADD